MAAIRPPVPNVMKPPAGHASLILCPA